MTSLDARLLLDREVLDDPNSFYHRLVVEARLEARVIIEGLLSATSEFHADEREDARWAPSLAVRRLDKLPLVLVPR